MNEQTLNWIFIVDTLNFSFWQDPPTFTVKYKGKNFTGYWSLCAAINRAIEENVPILDFLYLSNLDEHSLANILRGEKEGGQIPLLRERLQCLNEIGRVITSKFNGSFSNFVKEAHGSASKMLQMIVENFASYRDEANFQGKKVCFYKRAQILVADIWACFEGKGFGEFHDIDSITMFADYR